jgi:Icc-related predicted phosphoesterase
MRLFFVTDIHGSDVCFRKFINSGKFYQADVIILGGDTTGKMLVFLVDQQDGTFLTTYNTDDGELFAEGAKLSEFEGQVRNSGYYPLRVTTARMRELNANVDLMEQAFMEAMLGTWDRWARLAEERLRDTNVRCIIAPGNDDVEEIDEVIKASDRIEYGEGQILEVGGYELLSCGWTNPTPWDTPRECPEEELAERLEVLGDRVQNMRTAIFDLHAPPFNSGLDDAPQLKKGLQLVASGATQAVGSTAVRDFIQRHQPMLALHGHIHESRGESKIGRTVCVNPGSAYGEGVLQGYLADIEDGVVRSQLMVTG